jgi:hypothetical protein
VIMSNSNLLDWIIAFFKIEEAVGREPCRAAERRWLHWEIVHDTLVFPKVALYYHSALFPRLLHYSIFSKFGLGLGLGLFLILSWSSQHSVWVWEGRS